MPACACDHCVRTHAQYQKDSCEAFLGPSKNFSNFAISRTLDRREISHRMCDMKIFSEAKVLRKDCRMRCLCCVLHLSAWVQCVGCVVSDRNARSLGALCSESSLLHTQ